jgi:DNA-binding NarL/FixJ family response regulator
MNPETGPTASQPEAESVPIRALCIARHCFLSEHIARYFAEMGIITTTAVGLDSAAEAVGNTSPDVVICDYDMLANVPLERWEHNPLLSRTPVIAVSLTRHAEELHLLDVNGIAGFLYLPTLEKKPALQILNAAASRPKYTLGYRAGAPRPVERS